jgi:undecaprenol kinase
MIDFLEKDKLDREVKKDLNLVGLRIREIFKSHHPRRSAKSFKYAFKGVFHALLNEPNFRIQVLIVAATLALGLFFKITTIEWGLLIITGGLLLSAEMLNTVVEEFLDFIMPDQNDSVAVIKDLAAGFVLVMAFTSLSILLLVFGKYFIAELTLL